MSANDNQVGGSHYKQQYQHWDYATDLQMRHLEGAATKYLGRYGNKGGEPASKDLSKVTHYIQKLIEVFQEGRITALRDHQHFLRIGMPFIEFSISSFASELKGPPADDRNIRAIKLLSSWSSMDDLKEALNLVNELVVYWDAKEKHELFQKSQKLGIDL